jgi:uncharacterized protein
LTAPDDVTPPTVPDPEPVDPPARAVTDGGDGRWPPPTTPAASQPPPTGAQPPQAGPQPPPPGSQPPPPPPPAGQVAGPATPPEDVPDLDDRSRPLDRRVVNVWRISLAIGLLLPTVLVSSVAVGLLGSFGWLVAAVLLAATGLLVAWYPSARYARWRWRLTDLAVELDRGVIVRQAEALPYFRIQQIDVTRGPVDRLLGLASLQVTSASASGSVTLPGIAGDDAPGVRRALLARAAAAVGGTDSGVRDAV